MGRSQNFLLRLPLSARKRSEFLNKIITGIIVFHLQPGKQTPECNLGWPSVAQCQETCFEKSHIKTVLVAFFDSRGLIHNKFVLTGQTVNANFYKDVLDCLIKRFNCVRLS